MQHLRSLDQQPPNLLQHICPYQRPQQNPRMKHPYLQYQPMRALHGLAQAKCQATYLRTEIGCSHQITWTMPKRTKQKMNLKPTNVTSPKPQIKEEIKTDEQPIEKCSWGPGCPFCKSQEQKEEQDKTQPQKLSPKARQQATRPKTLSLNMTKAKKQWEEEMERLNSKYNLDCYSDSELDSESDEGEQYCYEHGYETLI